jgi:hypothetical protein
VAARGVWFLGNDRCGCCVYCVWQCQSERVFRQLGVLCSSAAFCADFRFFFWVFFVCVSFSDESWCSLGSHSTLDFFFNTFSCASSDGGYAVRDNILFVGFAFLFNAGYFPQFFRLFLRLRYISVFLELNATSTSTTSKLAYFFFFFANFSLLSVSISICFAVEISSRFVVFSVEIISRFVVFFFLLLGQVFFS